MRLYIYGLYLKFQVGPIPIDDGIGKEVVTRISTSMETNKTFYTDSNGRDFIKRVCYSSSFTCNCAFCWSDNPWLLVSDVHTHYILYLCVHAYICGHTYFLLSLWNMIKWCLLLFGSLTCEFVNLDMYLKYFLKILQIRDFRSDWDLEVNQPIAGNYYPVCELSLVISSEIVCIVSMF